MAPAAGAPLVQRESAPESLTWDFIVQPDDSYVIRMTGTDLYITTSSDKTNSAIILAPYTDAGSQKWRLIPQRPWF